MHCILYYAYEMLPDVRYGVAFLGGFSTFTYLFF